MFPSTSTHIVSPRHHKALLQALPLCGDYVACVHVASRPSPVSPSFLFAFARSVLHGVASAAVAFSSMYSSLMAGCLQCQVVWCGVGAIIASICLIATGAIDTLLKRVLPTDTPMSRGNIDP